MQSDCPICMDVLPESGVANLVVTSCGHRFHTSCLLTNVSHNGFGCPYCRTQLSEASSSGSVSSSAEDDDDSSYTEDELNDGMVMEVENVTHTDYVLRGLRWFMNRVSDEEPDDEEDVVPDEDEDYEFDGYGSELFSSLSQAVPPAAHITNVLKSQGITMEDLVNVLMYRTSDRSFGEAEDEEYERLSRSIHGRMRSIISEYVDREALQVSDLD